jgi:hypothetical protein
MRAVRIESTDLMAQVQAAMAADGGHNVPCVSHALFDTAGALRGAFSTVYAPALFLWMDSRNGHAMTSLRAMKVIQGEFRRLGHRRILLPIQSDSPFYPWVRSIGFSPIGPCELFEFNPPEE